MIFDDLLIRKLYNMSLDNSFFIFNSNISEISSTPEVVDCCLKKLPTLDQFKNLYLFDVFYLFFISDIKARPNHIIYYYYIWLHC